MPRVHAKKLSILAICALLETDPAALPQSIRDGWGSIMSGVLKTLREMPAAVEGMLILGFMPYFDDLTLLAYSS